MAFGGLDQPGTAKQPKSARFGQIWLFGRAWLVQPSEGHDETDFLGIKYCSTYKKVPKNPQTERGYFNDHFRSAFGNGDLLTYTQK